MKTIHVLHDYVDRAARRAVARKRAEVQPNAIAGDAHISWIGLVWAPAMREFQMKAKVAAIKIFGSDSAGDVEKRNGKFKQEAPRCIQ